MVYLLSIVFVMLVWGAHPAAVAAAGTTYYVRTGGSDGHSCSQAQTDSSGTAKASIQAGVNCVGGPGDTVIVHGGTYANFNSVTSIPGVSGSNLGSGAITLKAAPGETVTLRGGLESFAENWVIDGIDIDGGHINRDPLLIGNFHRIQNLTVSNGWYYGIAFGHDNEFINVHSTGHGTGPEVGCTNDRGNPFSSHDCHCFYTHQGPNLLDGVRCDNSRGHGIANSQHLGETDYGPLTVRNSVFDGSNFPGGAGGGSIASWEARGLSQYYNNVFIAPGTGALWLAGGQHQIFHNTFAACDSILLENNVLPGTRDFKNNILVNCSVENQNGYTTANNLCTRSGDGCTIVDDPRFHDAGAQDYHLDAGSPAIDAGLTLAEVPTDFDKNPRPQGRRSDIGAYEYVGSAPPPLSAPTNVRIAGQ